METQKTVNLLNDSNNLQQKNGILLAVKQKVITYPIMKLIFLTSSLESSLCDYSDAYILVTGSISITPAANNTKVAFKNYAPFKNCRTEINETFVDKRNILMLQCQCTI